MLIDPSRVRVRGPLAAFAAGFADELARQGYRPLAARNQMWLLAHLSRWLVSEEFGAHELRTAEVERFLRARRAAVIRSSSRSKRCSRFSVTSAAWRWCHRRRRPRPAAQWNGCWSDTGAI